MKTKCTSDRFTFWTLAVSGVALAGFVSLAYPLVYLWAVGIVACLGVAAGAAVIVASMSPLGFLVCGGEVIKAGLYVIGCILCGLADASK